MSAERVQKILARAGVAARRKVEDLIRAGRVTVNGEVVALGARADAATDAIKVDDRRIHLPRGHRYLLLNKPKGCLTAVTDANGRPTVIDLVPPEMRKALVPVGRLDYQTEGLLILTDDGDFAQRLSHPRYGCHKTYEVKVKGVPEESRLEKLRRGIVLDGVRTAPCRIEPLRVTARPHEEGGNSWFHVELSEGRTRQIREMFYRAGHPVQKLRRVAIGPLSDSALPVGALRELTDREIHLLRRATSGTPARGRPLSGKSASAGTSGGRAEATKPSRPRRPSPARPAASPDAGLPRPSGRSGRPRRGPGGKPAAGARASRPNPRRSR